MSIAHFIREIGRGKQGARHLSREQAFELMCQVLLGNVDPLALGAFCIAMRIKGETPEEMMGFLDAVHSQLQFFTNTASQPVVVLPTYNGARRLPLLTPLLAKLLANKGHPVLIHGTRTEDARVSTEEVLSFMGIEPVTSTQTLVSGEVVFAPTQLLSHGIWSLLQVRRQTGLRNSAHSLVKLMNPVKGPSLQIASYTHPEYASSMHETLQLMHANGLLLRGTEGEPVADPRKLSVMRCFVKGQRLSQFDMSSQNVHEPIDLPLGMNAQETAEFIESILQGHRPVPSPIKVQIELITRLSVACRDNNLIT